MERQLLILKILKVPVKLIKWSYRILSILTYIPNYYAIKIIDLILFNETIDSSLLLYSIFWILRVIAINFLPLIFSIQLYLIYNFLNLSQQPIYIQFITMISLVSISSLIMRRGYLQFISSFKPAKLKSPKQHLILYQEYLLDFIGIILALINALLITNIRNTINYNYNPKQRNYINFITKLLKSSIIKYLQLFYIKLIFKIFSWRYKPNQNYAQKQIKQNNLLQLWVLLNLILLKTIIDIIIIIALGWIPLFHPKVNIYLNNLRTNQQYWKIIIQFNLFMVVQFLQIILLVLCVFKIKKTWNLLKQICYQQSLSDNHLKQIFTLIIKSVVLIPYLVVLLILSLSEYKYKKYQRLKQKQWKYSQIISFQCLFQLLIQITYIIPILIATLMRPWNLYWIKYIINDNDNMDISYIMNYYKKNVLDLLWLITSLLLSCIVLIYNPSEVFKRIKIFYLLTKNLPELQRINSASMLKRITQSFIIKLRNDLDSIPMYFILKVTPLWILSGRNPNESGDCLEQILMWISHYRVQRSLHYQKYLQFFQIDNAAGMLKNNSNKLLFWNYSLKCERFKRGINILKFILPKSQLEEQKFNPIKYNQLSCISNYYWNTRAQFYFYLKLLIFLILKFIAMIFVIIVLIPLTLWRLPTFIIVMKQKPEIKIIPSLLKAIYTQLIIDIVLLVVHILAFILSPITYIIFRYDSMFYYGTNGVDSFKIIQQKKTRILYKIIQQKIKRIRIVIKAPIIICFYIRLKLYKQKLSLINQLQKQSNNSNNKIQSSSKVIVQFSLLQIFKLPFQVYIPSIKQILIIKLQTKLSQNKEYKKFIKIDNITNEVFNILLRDIPYLLALLVMFILMPWRYYYVAEVIKQFHQGQKPKEKFITLLKNSLTDYLCILMNILLAFSIVKTKKSIKLALKNYRLNFFVGFLDYSYFQELTKETIEALNFYHNMFILIITLIMNWPQSKRICKRIKQMYQLNKQEQQARQINRKIHDNTVKLKKDLNIIVKMGYPCFMTMCSYLQTHQIAKLSILNKLTYKRLKSGQIWMQKWQTHYQAKYQNTIKKDQHYKMCKQAYMIQHNQNQFVVKQTIHSFIISQFAKTIRNQHVSIKKALSFFISQQKINKLYRVRSFYHADRGYQVINNQQQQRQRQVRRLLGHQQPQNNNRFIQLIQLQMLERWFINQPIQLLIAKPNIFFRQGTHRKKKQIIVVTTIFLTIITLLTIIYQCFWSFWQLSRFFSLKMLSLIYFIVFLGRLFIRISFLYTVQWDSLRPFDIKNDLIQIMKACFQAIKKTIKVILKIIFYPLILLYRGIKFILSLLFIYLVFAGRYTKNKIIYPLYIKISNLIVFIFESIYNLIELFLNLLKFILKVIKNIFKYIFLFFKNIILSINNLYLKILQKSLTLFLNFGAIGQLIFTLICLIFMLSPILIWYTLYEQRWFLLLSIITTIWLIISGYSHLKTVKRNY